MNQTRKGFVISAVLYPLLVLFLALIMGLLAMTDTRKRILDKMKLEISDSIFDEATCSCDTILNKLNYLIKNGVGGSKATGLSLDLNIIEYETPSDLPFTSEINDIAVIQTSYSGEAVISTVEPSTPKEGMIWIEFNEDSNIYLQIDNSIVPLGLCYQYIEGEWQMVEAYIYNNGWKIFSDGYDNWKIMSLVSGVDYLKYDSLDSLSNSKEDLQKIFNSEKGLEYFIHSKQIHTDIKSTSGYHSNFVPIILDITSYTNQQKYELGLPFYIFNNGSSNYSFSNSAGCRLEATISSSSSGISGNNLYATSVQPTNCCGGRRIITSTSFDFSNYNKIYFNVTSYYVTTGTYGTVRVGYGTEYYDLKSRKIINQSGENYVDISEITDSYPIGIATASCSNENNNSNGTTLKIYVDKIYME